MQVISEYDAKLVAIAKRLEARKEQRFDHLVRLSGLDPARHLRYGDFSGVDFSDCDLRGFDFSGARLHNCRFNRALISGARFDGAEFGAVCLEREPGSHDPAVMTAVADLSKAADWQDYAHGWRKADKLSRGEYLEPGAIFSDAPRAPEMVVVPAGEFWMVEDLEPHSDAPYPRPRSIVGWNEERADLLKELWADGLTASQIARRLGGVSRNAVIGKAYRLGLYSRLNVRVNPNPRRKREVQVTIAQPFAVGRFAVTFQEWDRAQAHPEWRMHSGRKPRWPDDEKWGRGRRPVIGVSWEDARAYCRWLTAVTGKPYRLPSEAEWEYCCRASTETPFWWGASISTEQANYNGNFTYGGGGEGEYRQKTVPVDSFEANPWGLYQVHGNIWEWCEDLWHESYKGAPDDGFPWLQGADESHVLRGGSWGYSPRFLRAAVRNRSTPDSRYYDIGFRVVRTLES
jgi:formylglycine-generating enzyme required for sulfatase activity